MMKRAGMSKSAKWRHAMYFVVALHFQPVAGLCRLICRMERALRSYVGTPPISPNSQYGTATRPQPAIAHGYSEYVAVALRHQWHGVALAEQFVRIKTRMRCDKDRPALLEGEE
jgi:hypothetical protein